MQHTGPVGAYNDGGSKDGSPLETGAQFQPKELETFEADRETVLNIGSGSELTRGTQYTVGIHNQREK